MSVTAVVACALFALGYALIALERKLGTHKAALSLSLGAILWLLAAKSASGAQLHESLEGATSDIFGIVALLIGAMSLIEILAHYHFFDILQGWLVRRRLGGRGRFAVIIVMTFALSALLDNISVTIAMIELARRFNARHNLVVSAVGIVIAANAGGAWSPIGDVTSILLWLARKVTAGQLVAHALLPAVVLTVVATFLLVLRLRAGDFLEPDTQPVTYQWSERIVIGVALGSFTLPLVMNAVGLPPFLGLLLGLGITSILISFMKRSQPSDTHLEAGIDRLIQRIDLASITYIMGILLSVSALASLGALQAVYHSAMGADPSFGRLVGMNVVLGLASSLVDNSSLVSMAIHVVGTTDPGLWALTAIATGTGGSMLLIGSAAGVIADGAVEELSFGRYFRVAMAPALLGFVAAVVVWWMQTTLF